MATQFTERVIIVGIGSACIFASVSLLMGYSPEQSIAPIIAFVTGTFFPSLVERETAADKVVGNPPEK